MNTQETQNTQIKVLPAGRAYGYDNDMVKALPSSFKMV
jgi:hypothetical protein